jgi:glycosyltransferase involved in cell wall biosynthesis
VLSFSIVTPSLNQGRFIERTIRSVLDQDYSPLEYIVCDGGSTDETSAVLSRYANRLTAISEPDAGQANAVNKGFRSTSGEVIGWLNSDDVYFPGSLAQVAECFGQQPEADIVYGDAHLLDADDAVVSAYYTEPWNPDRLTERCFLCQPAVFWRRRVVDQFGLLDESLHYCLDYEYWLRLSARGARFVYLPTPLAGSRQYPQTKTLRAPLELHAELNAMLRRHLGRVPDAWLINNAHTLVELSRANRGLHLLPYALEVVLESLVLSWRWNASLSQSLVARALVPVAAGAHRRAAQSRQLA